MRRKNFLLILFAIVVFGSSCEENYVISDEAIIETCKTPNASYGKPYKYAILISWKTTTKSKSKSSTWYYTNKELCPYVGLTLDEALQRYYDSQRRLQNGPVIENRNTNEVHIYNYVQRDSLSP